MTTFIHPQLWFSELVAGFIWTIGTLWVWTFIHREHDIINDKFKKRIFTAFALLGITVASMVSGMFISQTANGWGPAPINEGGHSWGNPALSMSLAFMVPFKVFGEPWVFVLGIFYVIFMFLGGALALGVYVVGVWIYNSTTGQPEKLIRLTQIFKLDNTHPVRAFSKDAVAMMFVAFTFLGSTMMGTDAPAPFPSQPLFRMTSVLFTAFAMMTIGLMFGERMLLVINPVTWLMAFVLKFAGAIINNQRITWQHMFSEFASFMATMGAAVVVGLLAYLMINLPHTVDFKPVWDAH